MNKFDSLLAWVRDPFGYKRLHQTHSDVQKDMAETAGRTEKVTEHIQTRVLREQRRQARASRAHAIERVVLGQPRERRRTSS